MLSRNERTVILCRYELNTMMPFEVFLFNCRTMLLSGKLRMLHQAHFLLYLLFITKRLVLLKSTQKQVLPLCCKFCWKSDMNDVEAQAASLASKQS